MVGAALGMMFKSGNFLSAFALSAVPALVCIALIVTGQHTRGRYFAEDLRSVTEAGVTRVMALFFQHYTELGAGPAIEASPVGNIAPEQPYEQVLKSLAVMCDEEALERDSPPAPNTVGIAPAR